MNQVSHTILLNAIKTDNLVLFSSEIKGCENVCFGRFPLLSLCYLYNAKKIIKNYKNKLLEVRIYKVVTEPIELYKKFKTIAGRCLRLYVKEGCFVTPLEMLALLHKDFEVKKIYKTIYKNENVINNLKTIYYIFGQDIKIDNSKIKIGRKVLSAYQKLPYKISFFASLGLIFLVCVFYLIAGFTTGLGTNISPYLVKSQAQLIQAFNSTGSYVLKSDIELNSSLNIGEFDGVFDGGDHTIYVKDLNSFLVVKNNGTIKNLNIVYSNTQKEISNSVGLLAQINNGTIDNVKITVDSLKLTCNKSSNNDIYITGFVQTNNGYVENCSLKTNMIVDGVGDGECMVAGFVGTNNNTVTNCTFLQESSVTTTEADVAGVVVTNSFGATVNGCKNYANLCQTSQKNGWSPNVAGIAINNAGTLKNCLNKGMLSAISTNEETEANGYVYLGGICATNTSVIERCKNDADLTATSQKIEIYCGGISAYSFESSDKNNATIPNLKNCGVEGHISVETKSTDAKVYVGGIGGAFCGYINDCFSLASFEKGYTKEQYYVGTVIGLNYSIPYFNGLFYQEIFYVFPKNSFVLNQSNVGCQIAAVKRLAVEGQPIASELVYESEGLVTVEDENQIKQKEIYWNE